jgi:hypothetical protein
MVMKNLLLDSKASRLLTKQERAYILDRVANSSYYIDEFGKLDAKTEEALILSIFLKIQSYKN